MLSKLIGERNLPIFKLIKLNKMKKLRLDIDLISEELYKLILEEFKEQNSSCITNTLTDIEITCIVENENK